MSRNKDGVWDSITSKPTVSESDLNVLLCDDDSFTKMYLGEFKIDESQISLDVRLLQYYNETENCGNKYAMKRWKEFKRWAIGYSAKDIDQAKMRAGNKVT